MALLAECIAVAPRFARSANLERDATRLEPLDGYVVTTRALDVTERIARCAAAGRSGGAWSLTGPYGSGKSSLGLLLDAAFGPAGVAREAAVRLIGAASGSAGELVRVAHERHGTGECGFHRGLVTARRESLGRTVLRALDSAVCRGYGDPPPADRFAAADTLTAALDVASEDPYRASPSPTALVEIARCLAADRPLLLVLDEFGKNLEAAHDGSDSDPYLLQQLAEAGQGSGLPIFLLTLQHLSFEEHLAGADNPRRREWAKVQGRFEDVAYVESSAQTRALIGTAFEVHDVALGERITRWARREATELRRLGVTEMADPAVVASCYPLHPLAALVLPELCSRYGQHERTLFSFLTGADPASAASFLATTELPGRGSLPSLGLEAVYDYFVSGGAGVAGAGGRSSRWAEIATRLRDTHGLTDRQKRLAKSVAVLNLTSATGTTRASAPLLARCARDAARVLGELEAAGVLTYRRFADEYRVWQGSDVDISHLLTVASGQVAARRLTEVLTEIDPLTPQVAARHSAEHDTLRVFSRRWVDGGEPVEPLDARSPYDGEVLLVVGGSGAVPSMAESPPGEGAETVDGVPSGAEPAGAAISPAAATPERSLRSMSSDTEPVVAADGPVAPPLDRSPRPFPAGAKPVVAAIPANVGALDVAAREVAAVTAALDDPSVAVDWVARRELGERLAQARSTLESARNAALGSTGCRWMLLDGGGGRELAAGRGSSALSAAADVAYPSTPPVRNELLNRTALTSQGAKARRELLTAMIERGSEPDLGLSGFGPEVAMYRAFLARTGLHTAHARGAMGFRAPTDPLLQPAWAAFAAQLDRAKRHRINLGDVFAALRSPPIGMKSGAVAVFVTAGLLARTDDVALYEHGTFKPALTADLSERMVRNPDHFDLKTFANTTGARRQAVEALAVRLGVKPLGGRRRVANVVAVVSHLVARARRLDGYTCRTASLPATTGEVRDLLRRATEPDDLLFGALPSALGYPEVAPDAGRYPRADAYAAALGDALDDLEGCLEKLLAELRDLLLSSGGEVSRQAVSGQAAALEGEVLDSEVRAFVGALADDSAGDSEWMATVATVVARKAPAEWNDDDRERFRRELPQRLAAFGRLVALHAAHRADGGGPFDALRVTVTHPDGSEYVRLVGVDHRQRADLASLLDGTLAQLTDIVGSSQRATHTLLALLGEKLLPESSVLADEAAEGRRDVATLGEKPLPTSVRVGTVEQSEPLATPGQRAHRG